MPYYNKKRSYRKYSKKYRGKSSRKYRNRKFQSRVRQAILKTAETKYKIGLQENVALYHDRGTSAAGLLTSNQGAIVFNQYISAFLTQKTFEFHL